MTPVEEHFSISDEKSLLNTAIEFAGSFLRTWRCCEDVLLNRLALASVGQGYLPIRLI